MVAKYLGVDISVQGQNLIKPRESKMIGSAQLLLVLSWDAPVGPWGLDRFLTASKLWECCAVPQCLYGTGHGHFQSHSKEIGENPTLCGILHPTAATILIPSYGMDGGRPRTNPDESGWKSGPVCSLLHNKEKGHSFEDSCTSYTVIYDRSMD